MNFLDLLDGSKQWKPIIVPLDSSRSLKVSNGMSGLDERLDTASTSSITMSGVDYVEQYVKAEEEELLSTAKQTLNVAIMPGHKFDQLSMSTAAPDHQDLHNEDLMSIYKTYNFAHRRNEHLTIRTKETNIISMIDTYPVTIIQGPTGCGKTTQVPQFILDSCFKKRVHCNIIVTQPRRIAAISIAKRISQERDWPIGTLVGYQVGMVNHTSPDTRLTYCTTGVLLHKLITKKNMLDYTHVIIDEVHERDQDMDFLLLVVKKLQRSNSGSVKVLLMSATFNVGKFSQYFSIPYGGKLTPAPVVDVTKHNFFNLQVHYLCQIKTLGQLPEVSFDQPGVSKEMMNFCVNILCVFNTIDEECGHRSAVLIFLPGIYEIEEMHALLSAEENKRVGCDVVVLHSSITNEEQQRVFENPPTGLRRIILATNIAESSITVPDIKYVIDFCLTKQLVTDPITNYSCLEIGWASKANCEQRAGRAGRLMDGRVYRLVPKRFYENHLPQEGEPEMIRSPLENVVLASKLLAMGEPKAILALSMDPPDLSNLERTILVLKEAGGLVEKTDVDEGEDESEESSISRLDGDLTDLGRVMAALPLDIHITKLIVLGQVFSIFRQSLIIGASLAVKNPFSAQFQQKMRAYAAKLVWSENSASDCVSFLTVFNTWMCKKAQRRGCHNDAEEKRWARTHHLQIRVLREIEALVHEITKRLQRLGIVETVGTDRVLWSADELPLVIKIVIAGACYPNYFIRAKKDVEGESLSRMLGGLDPTKTVYLQGWPVDQPGILYAKRIQEHFQQCCATKVDKVIVSFDNSSRVYVQFRQHESMDEREGALALSNNDKPGEFSSAVYKALKLRTIYEPFEIPVMSSDASHERIEQLGIGGPKLQVFMVKDDEAIDIPTRQDSVQRPILPALDFSYVPIIVQRVITPGHFWAQLKSEDHTQKLATIQKTINLPANISDEIMTTAPKIGSFVLAPRSRAGKLQYFRAIIKNVSVGSETELLAKALYVDTGYTTNIRVSNLRKLKDDGEMAAIPAMSFECVLSEIRPSSISDISGQWSKASFTTFHELLTGNYSLYAQVYSVVDSVVHMELIRVLRDEKLNINEKLVELGFAEKKTEDYLSRCNHDVRRRVDDLSVKQRKHYEELQYDQSDASDCYPEPPALEDCAKIVRLKGPYSPAEIDLASLSKSGLTKKVNVDSQSVNSIILDLNPDDPYDRLLVAGSISQSQSGYSLSLRNTTLMPNIPGLTSILSLLFAPRIELRRNANRTRYTGALCGLGYDPSTKRSLFPEHDLCIYFDVDISMDDLQEINRLRYWMSLGVYVTENYRRDEIDPNSEHIALCQNRIKNTLFTLLKKRRTRLTRELDANFGKWCRYDERLFIPPGKIAMSKKYIYRLHNALELDEKNDAAEEMVAHMRELRRLSNRHFREDANSTVACQLCDVSLTGVFELRLHLSTNNHRQKEKVYLPFIQ